LEVLERHLAGLDHQQQVLPRLQRALEQVGVLEQPPRGVDELAEGSKSATVLQRGRQRESEREAVTCRSLASTAICGPSVTAP
jgi:hypothetical protein